MLVKLLLDKNADLEAKSMLDWPKRPQGGSTALCLAAWGCITELSQPDLEILQLLVEGHSNKDIAVLLHLSPHTVETHRKNLQSKLNVHSFAELILYAVRKGLMS